MSAKCSLDEPGLTRPFKRSLLRWLKTLMYDGMSLILLVPPSFPPHYISRWTWVNSSLSFFFAPLVSLENFWWFLRFRCPSCHPTNILKLNDGNSKHWPKLGHWLLSWSTVSLLWQGPLLPLHHLSNTITLVLALMSRILFLSFWVCSLIFTTMLWCLLTCHNGSWKSNLDEFLSQYAKLAFAVVGLFKSLFKLFHLENSL